MSNYKTHLLFPKTSFLKTNMGLVLLFIGTSIVMFIIALMVLGFTLSRVAVFEFFLALMPQKELRGVNVLAVGVDDTLHVKRSDTIIVFHLNPENKRIGVLSIPRDTRVKIEGLGFTKINHAYAHGGAGLLRHTVSNLLGIPIDYYLKVNIDGIKGVIDGIGGVSIDIAKDLVYTDNAADLHINLKKGNHHLNGEEAVQYLRFRHDSEGDIGRIARQQKFMQGVAQQVTGPKAILDLPFLIRDLSNLIETDLGTGEMVGLAMQFANAFKGGHLQKGTVPGSIALIDGVSYWRPNLSKMDSIVQDVLLYAPEPEKIQKPKPVVEVIATNAESFETEELLPPEEYPEEDVVEPGPEEQVSQEEASPTPMPEKPVAVEEAPRPVTIDEVSRVTQRVEISNIALLDSPLKVEILNGVGQAGLAKTAGDLLTEMSVEVPILGNAGHFGYEETVVVDWKGNVDRVLVLVNLLQIDPSRIIVYDRPNKPIDATVVLGKDWPEIYKQLKQQ